MLEVEDAVILAAGHGTRMLPASLYAPKEVLPLIDSPLLNHLIWEACKAGVKRIHIVISPIKRDIIEKTLKREFLYKNQKNLQRLPKIVLHPIPKGIELLFHEQKTSGGVGDAISIPAKIINGPFLVILGDNILMREHVPIDKIDIKNASGCSKRLVDFYNKNALACAGVIKVGDDVLSDYGVVAIRNNIITNIVEKPNPDDAPSNLILCGRYLLPENTSELLKFYSKEKYGELQSIELFRHVIKNDGLGYVDMSDYSLYDSGNPYSWLKSQIDHALKRKDIKEDFRIWINERLSK